MRIATLPFLAAVVLTLGCGIFDRSGAASDDCTDGTLECPCAVQGCIGGLVCIDSLCLDPFADTDDVDVDNDPTQGPGDDESSAGETTASSPGGPTIVDFGANLSRLSEGETVIFSATVIDPDGPDDIQGGSLKNVDGTITFRPFEDIGNGTFGVTLSWSELHLAAPIDFNSPIERTFVADFFDNQGNIHSQSTTLELYCDDDSTTVQACDGACVDLFDDAENCGACGFECEDTNTCVAGSCEGAWGECIDRTRSDVSTCAEFCAQQGEACTTVCEPGGTVSLWFEPGCSGTANFADGTSAACTIPAPEDFESARCCCTVDAVFPT